MDSPLTTPGELARLAVWIGVVAILVRGRGGRGELAALGALAVLALGAYTGFGRFHGEGRLLHDHELVHYTMGSRYHAELGHDGLYAALHHALLTEAPTVGEGILGVKNLRTYSLEPAALSAARGREITRRFTPERWDRFRADVACFVERLPAREWAVVLADHGYNATPFWTVLGGALTGDAPLTDARLHLLALLDPLLLLVALGFVAGALGPRAGLLATVVVLATPLAPFDVVGGAYLRQLWLAGVLVFAAARARGLPVIAGAALAVAALDRVFPGLLLLVPLVEMFGSDRARSARREVAAFALTAVALVAVTGLAGSGIDAWRAFIANVIAHDRWFYFNQVAFRNVLEIDPRAVLALHEAGWNEGSWLRLREAGADRVAVTLVAMRMVAVAIAVVAVRRAPAPERLGVAAFLPFVLAYPASYYHVLLVVPFLAGFAARRLAILIAALMAGVIVLHGALPGLTRLEAVYWALSVGLTLAFLDATLRHARGGAMPRAAGIALVAIPVVGIAVDGVRGHRARTGVDLDLLPGDVIAPPGVEVTRTSTLPVGAGWSRNDQIVLSGSPGAPVRIPLPRMQPGRYRMRVTATAGPGLDAIRLVPPTVRGSHVPLGSAEPHPILLPLRPVTAGPDPVELVVTIDAPGATTGRAALDRVELWPDSGDGAGHALDLARGWIDAHPADLFDGGVLGIVDEAWTRHLLGDDAGEARQATARALERLAPIRHDDLDGAAFDRIAWLASRHGLSSPAGREKRSHPLHRDAIDRERATAGLRDAFAAGVPLPRDPVVPAVAALTAELGWLQAVSPLDPGSDDAAWWRAWHEVAVGWAIAHADPITLARLVDSAAGFGTIPHRDAAAARLVALQGPDGTMGIAAGAGTNLVRAPVLAGARALHHLAEG